MSASMPNLSASIIYFCYVREALLYLRRNRRKDVALHQTVHPSRRSNDLTNIIISMNRKSRLGFLPLAALAFGLSTLSSCDSDFEPDITKTSDLSGQNVADVKTVGESEAQESFAKILSMAASKDAALRRFLKTEAEKQYDNDYDVFYPYVKDAVVEDGRTLRDVLLSYSSEEELGTLENSLPLLTIMIPDLSAFGAFSVYKWDPKNEQVAVTYAKGNDSSVFYSEGDSILSLPAGSLPSFPFLVVKSNERMKVVGTGTTRAGQGVSYQYDFVDPAFDGSKTAHTRANYYDENNTEVAPEEKPYLRKDEIDPKCVEAYNFHKKDEDCIDREYIYYGLSPIHKENGHFNVNYREKLYKFRIDPLEYYSIADLHINDDPALRGDALYKKGHPSTEQIAKDLWTDGAFEICVEVFSGTGNPSELKIIPVKGNDLFYISKFHVRHQHATGFRHNKWWYSTTLQDLKGRWVDISSDNVYVDQGWDLASNPLSRYIRIYEKDKGAVKTESTSYTVNYAYKVDVGYSGAASKHNWNIGFSTQIADTKTVTFTYQYKDEDDVIGTGYIHFNNPIIVSDSEVGVKGYSMYTVNTKAAQLIIAPTRIR